MGPIKTTLKFISTRVILVYGILFGLSLWLVDYDYIKNRMAVRALNDNMPTNFSYLIRLGEGTGDVAVEKVWLKEFENYYEKVVHYMPQLAEAHGMLGFSYYYLGKEKEALVSYKKAAVLNPHFFWFHYNLGVLYFLKGDYQQAAVIFENAKDLKPQIVLYVLKNSVVYQRALRTVTNIGDIIMEKLKTGYSECYRLLVLSHFHQKNYPQMLAFSKEAIESGLAYREMFFYYSAVAAYHMNKFEISVTLLQEAIKIDPEYAQAYYYLGLNLKALGREETAQQALAKALILRKEGKEKLPKEDEAHLRIL